MNIVDPSKYLLRQYLHFFGLLGSFCIQVNLYIHQSRFCFITKVCISSTQTSNNWTSPKGFTI